MAGIFIKVFPHTNGIFPVTDTWTCIHAVNTAEPKTDGQVVICEDCANMGVGDVKVRESESYVRGYAVGNADGHLECDEKWRAYLRENPNAMVADLLNKSAPPPTFKAGGGLGGMIPPRKKE